MSEVKRAQPGTEVIFSHPNSGGEEDVRTAAKHLVEGVTYTIDHVVEHGFQTQVFLQEVEDIAFNAVQFEYA